MPARMSCSLTVEQVRDRSKSVTRRHADSWKHLRAGDRLTLIEKGMGLRKGEHQVVITTVEVVDVRLEPLYDVDELECVLEGFPEMEPSEFIEMWLDSHGVRLPDSQTEAFEYEVRRIEWRYLDEEARDHQGGGG